MFVQVLRVENLEIEISRYSKDGLNSVDLTLLTIKQILLN